MPDGFNYFVRSRSFVVTISVVVGSMVLATTMTAIAMPTTRTLVPRMAVSAPSDVLDDPPGDAVACHDAAMPRQRTEVDSDVSVPQFDPTLGRLMEVSVPEQEIQLDTDARFENVAQSAVVFGEHMTYGVTLTSPGALASPPAISGAIERVPSQTIPAFDGTVDFAGLSAVAQPSTSRNEHAAVVTTTDPAILDAFTGAATMQFHVATQISETFMGGGGNVAAVINTYVAASIRVCYRYAPSAIPTKPRPSPPVVRPTFTG